MLGRHHIPLQLQRADDGYDDDDVEGRQTWTFKRQAGSKKKPLMSRLCVSKVVISNLLQSLAVVSETQ